MRRFCAFVLLCALAPLPVIAAAQKPAARIPDVPPVIANYDVYVGGLHLVEAHILFEQGKGAYRTRVHASTHGFWHKLLPWDAHFDVHGHMTKDRFVPIEYDGLDEWHKKPKLTKLNFDRKGGITASFDPPNTDQNREIVTAEQKKGALDPVTALLQILAHIAVEKNCDVTVNIFDGKRRFDVTGIDTGEDYIDEEDYGVFKGTAHTCDADFKMISGEWKDREPSKFWQKSETEAGREPFHAWLGPVGPQGTELPVRLESSSVFGLIIVHLSGWHVATPEELKN